MESNHDCASETSIEQILAQSEWIIRRAANRAGTFSGFDFDDVCQELRIKTVDAARRYDSCRGIPWVAYLSRTLRLHCIDLKRAMGDYKRTGARRRNKHIGLDHGAPANEQGDFDQIDPTDDGDGIGDCDWDDLVEKAESESPQVYALVLYAGGLRMREVAQRLEVSESWVSLLLSKQHPTHPQLVSRMKVLLGVG